MAPISKNIVYSLGLGLLYYLIDGVLDKVLLYSNMTLPEVLLTAPPLPEVYSRIVGACMIILAGFLIPGGMSLRSRPNSSGIQKAPFTADPGLMANISNEIRIPLNAIMGFVDLLKDGKISETSKNLYISHIQTSGKYLLELINNVTNITLIESGAMQFNKEVCRLNQLLGTLLIKYEKQLAEKGKTDLEIRLRTGVDHENFTLLTDKTRLTEILDNLLENALYFTHEGIIEFGYIYTRPNTFEFFVTDTGTGLSSERMRFLLVKNQKLGANQLRPFDIVALRISIAQHLAQLFGGELLAESTLGKGSDFRFRINAEVASCKKDDVPARSGIPVSNLPAKWADKKVLIAEDVESNFVYLKEILKPSGIQVFWAENGNEAVKLCREYPDIDLVLMDILMPELDGYEAAKAIKKELPDLPIIAQTAYNIDEIEYKDASTLFSKFMIKPIWSIDLLNTLKNYLT